VSRRIRLTGLLTESPANAGFSYLTGYRDLTDLAPWVPLYTQYGADFVSTRVGNYQHHPLWGALFAQLRVR
jgi:hypothetical protein